MPGARLSWDRSRTPEAGSPVAVASGMLAVATSLVEAGEPDSRRVQYHPPEATIATKLAAMAHWCQ